MFCRSSNAFAPARRVTAISGAVLVAVLAGCSQNSARVSQPAEPAKPVQPEMYATADVAAKPAMSAVMVPPAPSPAMESASVARSSIPVAMEAAIMPPQPMPMPLGPVMQPEGNERYDSVKDNPVKRTAQESVSTLSLDVDTGSYSNVRRFLNQGAMPPKDAVRVEELINYFPYEHGQAYSQGQGGHPFAVSTELGRSPWNGNNLLLRVGVKAMEQQVAALPPANLVFLVDVSGSMQSADKLPLVQATLRQLVQQLRAQDKVSLVTYSGRTQVELESTSGAEKEKIFAAIARLSAGGSTAGGAALELAYQQANAGFIKGGINRILLATDGDFNVGISDVSQIKSMVERERAKGVSLTTLGFGQGNYNEALMQQIAQVGNGNYSYIDSLEEGRKVLVEELASTFNSVAADVKMQLELNPATVAEWRLIGYENRLLDEADFRNDKVDAVEIGAGKSVTALYELTLVGQPTLHGQRRYGTAEPANAPKGERTAAARTHLDELGQLRIRYKKPGESASVELAHTIGNKVNSTPSADWKFAAAVAGFGQLLRGGVYTGQWSYDDVRTLAVQGYGEDEHGYRRSFVKLVELAKSLDTN